MATILGERHNPVARRHTSLRSGSDRRQTTDDRRLLRTPHSALRTPISALGIIGAGKVGTALAALLHARGIEVAGVSGRSMESSRRVAGDAGLPPDRAATRAET